ncbi:unnamed protein product [Chilo suppressalis]|uniref:Multiple inositol polyphosphate phosphatase 1 n=1 Tax=Chilo suppressalis TaxID=168631 RepID=A0ABN8L4Y1_CHISP|nr:unnamed protein product [Chilo suppressalis]
MRASDQAKPAYYTIQQAVAVPPQTRVSDAAFPAHFVAIDTGSEKLTMRWLAALFVLAALAHADETCLSVDEEPYFLFGTKTAYIFANRGLSNNNRAHEIPGCEPIAFWLLSRPGSTLPEHGEMDALRNLADLKQNIADNYRNQNFRNTNRRICTSDLNLLEQWSWNPRHNVTFAGDLTSDGYINTQGLAQAWKQKYPGLLNDNRYNYLFKYVNDKLSSTTFKAFTEGLFRTQADGLDLPKENDEKLLRPYQFCDSWKKNVENNKETLAQREIFESKLEYKQMVTNISQRLGFNYDVEPTTIRNMYQMCRYNKAWEVAQVSPWCSVFTREDLRRLEYAEDLETYYKYGPGTDLNKKVGCAHIKDMIDFFKNHTQNEMPLQPRTVIQFVELASILLTVNAMGARNDAAPLTGDNYHTAAVQARKWTNSIMTPYNANLAAVLYKCTLNGNFGINDRYQVLFLENEKPISLDGCRVGLCNWSHVTKTLGAIADACDLQSCNHATTLNNYFGISLAVGFLVIRLVAF